nr:hypothetical protein CR513_14339 [Ipomoea batatas]
MASNQAESLSLEDLVKEEQPVPPIKEVKPSIEVPKLNSKRLSSNWYPPITTEAPCPNPPSKNPKHITPSPTFTIAFILHFTISLCNTNSTLGTTSDPTTLKQASNGSVTRDYSTIRRGQTHSKFSRNTKSVCKLRGQRNPGIPKAQHPVDAITQALEQETRHKRKQEIRNMREKRTCVGLIYELHSYGVFFQNPRSGQFRDGIFELKVTDLVTSPTGASFRVSHGALERATGYGGALRRRSPISPEKRTTDIDNQFQRSKIIPHLKLSNIL